MQACLLREAPQQAAAIACCRAGKQQHCSWQGRQAMCRRSLCGLGLGGWAAASLPRCAGHSTVHFQRLQAHSSPAARSQ